MEKMKEVPGQSIHIVAVNGDRPGVMKSISGGTAAPAYSGETVFTPSDETQVIPVLGYRMKDNITINPVPGNYGRISWNGSALTVY